MNPAKEEKRYFCEEHLTRFETLFNLENDTLQSADDKIAALKSQISQLEDEIKTYKGLVDKIKITEQQVRSNRGRGYYRNYYRN